MYKAIPIIATLLLFTVSFAQAKTERYMVKEFTLRKQQRYPPCSTILTLTSASKSRFPA